MDGTVPDAGLIGAGDLRRLPDVGARRFLVRGRVVEQPYRTAAAGAVAGTLCVLLGRHVETYGLGDVLASGTGFQIASDPDTVLAPAVAFVGGRRSSIDDGYFPGVPDLAVEVVSTLDDPRQVDAFVVEWLAARCPMVVVVDVRRRNAAVHRPGVSNLLLTENDSLDGGEVVPGWTLPLKDLFG